jgi:hypothetical protein
MKVASTPGQCTSVSIAVFFQPWGVTRNFSTRGKLGDRTEGRVPAPVPASCEWKQVLAAEHVGPIEPPTLNPRPSPR